MSDTVSRQRFDELDARSTAILAGPRAAAVGQIIGRSREGREIRAVKIGSGARKVSLLAGCHADEPVGPRLLRQLSHHLSGLAANDPLLVDYQWWIIPHINPDGAARNRHWQPPEAKAYDLAAYLLHAVRELPGDDIEFGFPHNPDDAAARPENSAVYRWWRSAAEPFDLHVSLHGMAFAAGPWFLIEEAWRDRVASFKQRCLQRVADLGYRPHDVDRRGEKGFFRLSRGFCTRPDSRYMRAHFRAQGDEETANKFRPSSMETIRALGGDPLTLVSEMPLFITPGVGESLGPPDPAAEAWKQRIAGWKADLLAGASREDSLKAVEGTGLTPMPVEDQMCLQWTLIVAGLEACAEDRRVSNIE